MTQPFDGLIKHQIIRIVGRSLAYIDERLIDHGERVAYIADQIASMDHSLAIDRDRLTVLCLLHDIGAYKTEEIDDMVCFETTNVMKHSVYGYVFLKNTTSLGTAAEAILYHHTPYVVLETIPTPQKLTAELIFLADRIDILIASQSPVDWERLKQLNGTDFSPLLMGLFFKAEQKNRLVSRIRDGSYKKDVLPRLEAISLPDEENVNYLKMLVYSIDFRSPFTVTHTANTVSISAALAELFALNEHERRAVFQGAFFHDIGKIAIPYAILEKPGKLTPEQMTVMKTHVAVSESILSGVVPDEICQIAIRHHEKLNGKGYHRGLPGEALTLPQRIVAVADVLSALINRRSYKEAFPKEKALAIIGDMRDAGELCPRVCAMVAEHYDAIISEVAQADDPIIQLYERIRDQYAALMETFS